MKDTKKFKIRKNYFSSIAKILSFYKTANIETIHPDVRLIELRIIDEIIEKMKEHSSDLALCEISMIFRACRYLDACLYGGVAFNNDLPEFQAFIDPYSELDETFEEISPLFKQAGLISTNDDESDPRNIAMDIPSSITVSIDDLLEPLQAFKDENLDYVKVSFLEAQEDDDEIIPTSLYLGAFSKDAPNYITEDFIDSIEFEN